MSGKTYPFFETEKDDISPLFTSKLQDQAHVGFLRGRFQDGGIAVDWFGGNEPLCTPEFDAELKDLLKNLCQDGNIWVEFRGLRQVFDAFAAIDADFSCVGSILPGHNAQQRGFSGAVNTDDTDFVTVLDAEVDFFKKGLDTVGFFKVYDG